jgi:hypothetical protein
MKIDPLADPAAGPAVWAKAGVANMLFLLSDDVAGPDWLYLGFAA